MKEWKDFFPSFNPVGKQCFLSSRPNPWKEWSYLFQKPMLMGKKKKKKQLKWRFSQLQGKKDFVKIWRIERKVGSAHSRNQCSNPTQFSRRYKDLLIKLGSAFPGAQPGYTSLEIHGQISQGRTGGKTNRLLSRITA